MAVSRSKSTRFKRVAKTIKRGKKRIKTHVWVLTAKAKAKAKKSTKRKSRKR